MLLCCRDCFWHKMKTLIRICAVAALLSALPRVMARTFTAADGRTLEGEITDAGEAEVTIRRAADARLFKLRIETLSKQDQEDIARWRSVKALGRITVSAIKDKVANQKQSSGGGSQIVDAKAQSWCWVITLKNGTNLPVTGLQLNYSQIVERTDRNSGAVSGAAKKVARSGTGTIQVPDIKPFGSVTLQTDGMEVLSYKSTNISTRTTASGDSVTTVTSYKWDEALSGLGVELFHGADSVLNWKTGTDPAGRR